MPNEKHEQHPQSLAKDYLALNTLRDYVYQNEPHKFLATDFVEDIPSLRPVGMAFSNILPSAAIISRDPAERKKQIEAAVAKMRQAGNKEHSVTREALTSAAKFGLGSIPLSLAFGMAEKSFHVPGLRNLIKGERPRITFHDNFKTPEAKQELKTYLKDSVTQGIAQGAVFGTIPSITSNSANFNEKNYENASKVLNKHPSLASLPGADLAALNNIHKHKKDDPNPEHLKNVLKGTALGAGLATVGQGVSSLSRLGGNLVNPIKHKIKDSLYEAIVPKVQKFIRGRSNEQLIQQNLTGLNSPGRAAFGRSNVGLSKKLKQFKPNKPKLHTLSSILEPLHPRSLAKPVASFALLGGALSGLGSYLSHPAEKHV